MDESTDQIPPPPGASPVESNPMDSTDAPAAFAAPTPSEPAKRRRWPKRLLVLAIVATLAGFAGAQVATEMNDGSNATSLESSETGQTNDRAPSQPVLTAAPGAEVPPAVDVAAVVDRISASIVTVVASAAPDVAVGRSTGTGVVITSDGEILTNAHVVEASEEVSVLFGDSFDPIPAMVLAIDVGNDLALLKVDLDGLMPAVFADPESIAVGDEVVAVGFALDLDGGPTVTRGIVSAINRTITYQDGALDGLIQTDAAISSGNSGGPLLNSRGEVVGINTAVFTSSGATAANNVGFAISVSEALPVVDVLRDLAEGEARREGYLGVGLDNREDGGRGALITDVEAGSPADRAGIVTGDIVVDVDGTPIDGLGALIAAIRDRSPGETLAVEVVRDGRRLSLSAVLVERPAN